ncbi:MAG: class I SAM-dependent methyltransferase [Chitinophagales bacterium]
MTEGFRPVSNTRDQSFIGQLKFYGRMLLDLQILTIFRAVKRELPHYSGNVLDVGCGQSPYRFLLDETKVNYFGIDIVDADKFDYDNSHITPFNGKDIPFENEKFDAVLCTEVLEHVEDYQQLVNEMYRVMKPGAKGIVTIPWSARYHYIPWDYFRYTPSALKTIFSNFREAKIENRGTDIAVIGNKVIVLFFRNLIPSPAWRWIFVPFWILLLPVLALMVVLAHLALLFGFGTDEDPLGYTILLKK